MVETDLLLLKLEAADVALASEIVALLLEDVSEAAIDLNWLH